jgi:hypothetical protein
MAEAIPSPAASPSGMGQYLSQAQNLASSAKQFGQAVYNNPTVRKAVKLAIEAPK